MTSITKDNVIELLEKAVAKRGADFIYEQHESDEGGNCLYVFEGKPDCIVGQVLADALPEEFEKIKAFEEVNNSPAGTFTHSFGSGHFEENVPDFKWSKITEPARFILREVQRVQDGGNTWGEALQRGKDIIAEESWKR